MNTEQMARYARHLSLPEIGAAGQERLLRARALIVGLGGLGSAAAYYLAAAGVGYLGLMDDDCVEASNLQRQILHGAGDIGRPKIESAASALHALNPEVELCLCRERLTAHTKPELPGAYDFVVDATDNFASKFAVADICHAAARPYAHAGILQFYAQVLTVIPGRTACCRCVFDEREHADGSAAPRGPLGALPGIAGCIQAAEALKYLLGIGELLTNRLLTFDILKMKFREVPVNRNARCVLCGA